MTEAKFTSRPWEVGHVANGKKWVISFDCDPIVGCEYIGLSGYNKLQTNADLNLIAAAPDMYQIIQGLLDSEGIIDHPTTRVTINRMLAKARGEVEL